MKQRSKIIARFGRSLNYEAVKAQSPILNRYTRPDGGWFWISASINPYRGCEHNCLYCDGKAEYYRIENFATHIQVKTNAPQLLTKELIKLGFYEKYRPGRKTLLDYLPESSQETIRPDIKVQNESGPKKFLLAVGGGVCDIYQPAEAKFNVTRELLKVVRNFGFPISVLTKNTLVLRDLDLLTEINDISQKKVHQKI